MFASKSCVPNPSLSEPTLPSRTQLSSDELNAADVPGLCVFLSPEKVESLLSNLDSDSATGRDGINPRVPKPALLLLLTLSLSYSPSLLIKVICLLVGNQET